MWSLWRAERLGIQREITAYICLCMREGMPGMWAISGNLHASNSTLGRSTQTRQQKMADEEPGFPEPAYE